MCSKRSRSITCVYDELFQLLEEIGEVAACLYHGFVLGIYGEDALAHLREVKARESPPPVRRRDYRLCEGVFPVKPAKLYNYIPQEFLARQAGLQSERQGRETRLAKRELKQDASLIHEIGEPIPERPESATVWTGDGKWWQLKNPPARTPARDVAEFRDILAIPNPRR
jgi:hypothetical protein